ncbi:MAG: hypothetical protein IT562_10900 [Alphaproteobacteria bacterium]|nr:hypothetical protein [Alphaproteobacteria bacterium]
MTVRGFVVAMLLASVAMIVLGGFARSQEVHTHHGRTTPNAVDRFYSTWMKPDRPNESCCNKQDCDTAEVKQIAGIWWARRPTDKRWVMVPPEKIDQHRDSPDGGNHFCATKTDDPAPYCLVIGSGT